MREHGAAFFVLEICKTMPTPTKIGMDIGVKRLKMGLEIDVNLRVKSGGNAHQGGHLWLVGLIEDAREV